VQELCPLPHSINLDHDHEISVGIEYFKEDIVVEHVNCHIMLALGLSTIPYRVAAVRF
jgi:hypothetical protein